MTQRVIPTRDGRFGIQQRIRDVWTFTTIGCGYEMLADALADVDRCGDTYRVADRTTGEVFTNGGDGR